MLTFIWSQPRADHGSCCYKQQSLYHRPSQRAAPSRSSACRISSVWRRRHLIGCWRQQTTADCKRRPGPTSSKKEYQPLVAGVSVIATDRASTGRLYRLKHMVPLSSLGITSSSWRVGNRDVGDPGLLSKAMAGYHYDACKSTCACAGSAGAAVTAAARRCGSRCWR
jgi:hypothetical protein